MTEPSPTGVSILLPTFNERENIAVICDLLAAIAKREGWDAEIVVIDDGSPDGTADLARDLDLTSPVKVVVREGERGLATAVLKGFEEAKHDLCVVMDADLSHPVDRVPAVIEPLVDGRADMVIGSRYIDGGVIEGWPFHRFITSKVAGVPARFLTRLRDPLAGFFALDRNLLGGRVLNPPGYKIALEILCQCNPQRVEEVPITFKDRQYGKSKLTLGVQLAYLRQVFRLVLTGKRRKVVG